MVYMYIQSYSFLVPMCKRVTVKTESVIKCTVPTSFHLVPHSWKILQVKLSQIGNNQVFSFGQISVLSKKMDFRWF